MNKVLINLSKVIGLYIPFKNPTYNKFYGIITCLMYLLYSGVMIYVQNSSRTEDILTSLIQSLMLMVANFMMISKTVVSSDQFLQLLNSLEDIARLNSNLVNVKRVSKDNYVLFVIAQISYVVFMACSYYVWGHFNYAEFLMQIIPEYIYLTVFLLQWEILNVVHESIECLNENISYSFIDSCGFADSARQISISKNLDGIHVKLNTMLHLLEKYNDVVIYYNHHYGWNILFSTLIACHYLLGFFAELFTKDLTFSVENIYGYIVQIYNLFQGVILPIKCEHLMYQRMRLTSLLNKVFHRYSKYPGLSSKLNVLMEQSKLKLEFSAAGFFNLNYASLFTLTNMMITYLIVIIQFKKAKGTG